MTISVVIAFAILFILIILILARLYSSKAADFTPQLLDLKNQLGELKTRQLEGQNASLAGQQRLLMDTQQQLNTQLERMMSLMGQNLNSAQSNITKQLENSNRVIGDIHTKLGALEKTAKNMEDIGKDISSLQEILQAPKLRGNIGEFFLEDLLKQILPAANFEIKPPRFKNGTQVDAIIKLGGNIVPVDSKFPLESFQRYLAADNDDQKKVSRKEFITSVKARVDEITKYINTAEGTFNFAIMYIPAENVYYETIINDSFTNKDYEIFNYAMSRNVIPVSPNSFYAYLQALVYGLKGMQIEKETKNILGQISQVQEQFKKFFDDYNTVGRHLNNAVGKFNESEKRAEKINDRVNRLMDHEVELIEDK